MQWSAGDSRSIGIVRDEVSHELCWGIGGLVKGSWEDSQRTVALHDGGSWSRACEADGIDGPAALRRRLRKEGTESNWFGVR